MDVTLAWTLLLLTLHPQVPIAESSVETVELNSLYCHDGRWSFDQLIFWDREPHVIDWRMVKGNYPWRQGRTATWWDKDTLRRVKFSAWHRTWRQYDPEVDDRQFVPSEERRGL